MLDVERTDFSNDVRLGKDPYKHDPLTIMMAEFFQVDLRVPIKWDFDAGRAAFPMRTWGNTQLGDCVIAGQANHTLRFERVEQRRTISLVDDDAIKHYEEESIRQFGSYQDQGLVVLYNHRDWRNVGWSVSGMKGVRWPRTYKIEAYGELDPNNREQLRTAIYYLQGIQLGFWLPVAAQSMTNSRVWDYQGQTGPEWEPGSWGGHLVYSKAFDPESLEILTWGLKVKVTNAFIEKYCDEAWASVDKLDSWRTQQTINVPALQEKLQQISGRVNQ